jgi:rhodanese-related sulfurtransferase
MAYNSIQDVIKAAASGALTVIDVRESGELRSSGQAKGALHIPLGVLAMKADPCSPDYDARIAHGKPVAVYCASGGRSGMAAMTLNRMGYETTNIGGFGEWVGAGGPVSRA